MTAFADIVARLREAGCVFAEDEARLLIEAAGPSSALEALVRQRVAGLPLEQVLGWAEFCGLRIAVEPGVFVPRQRTEFLVEQAVRVAHDRPVVVDLCCGSGAVGAALLSRLAGAELYAVDIDPAAVRCARRNLAGAHVAAGDLYDALPLALQGRVDLLVANAPYVPTDAIAMLPPEARLHEPAVALDGGADGLDVHRRVAADAAQWLAPNGRLLIEVAESQVRDAIEIFAASGLTAEVAEDDELSTLVVLGSILHR